MVGCALLAAALPLRAADLPELAHSLTPMTAQAAPPLKLTDLNGLVHELAKLRGKVVVVNFWATWCPPCRREMPSLQRLRESLAREPFAVLAVNIGESVDTIELFTSQLESPLDFPILLDKTSATLKDWRVAGLPTTYVVDKKGRVVAHAIGGREFDHPEVVNAIRKLLKQ